MLGISIEPKAVADNNNEVNKYDIFFIICLDLYFRNMHFASIIKLI